LALHFEVKFPPLIQATVDKDFVRHALFRIEDYLAARFGIFFEGLVPDQARAILHHSDAVAEVLIRRVSVTRTHLNMPTFVGLEAKLEGAMLPVVVEAGRLYFILILRGALVFLIAFNFGARSKSPLIGIKGIIPESPQATTHGGEGQN